MTRSISQTRTMPRAPALWRAVVRSVGAVAALLAGNLLVEDALAQGGAPKTPAITAAHLSLQTIWQAPQNLDYTAVQLRRFYALPTGPGGMATVTTVREQLVSDSNGTPSPAFVLSFLGVEGELPGSPLHLQWDHTYQKHSRRFHESGSFRIRDLAHAQANYTLHSFVNVVRAGRSATRMVVYPGHLDKSIWVVDVDVQTSLPLYTAEFDRQLRILSEVEVVSLTLSAQVPPPPPGPVTMREYSSFVAATQEFEDDLGLVEPDLANLPEYHLRKAIVREDLLNQRKTLQLTYTDGVDEFQLVQEMAPTNPFAGLPSQNNAPGTGVANPHTIARYSDHSMRVLLFWADDVSFQVAGRGSLARLDEFARNAYGKALTQ